MMRVGVCDTPIGRERSLFLATRQPQQLAIAAVHQRQPGFDKADGPIAQVVGLPGSFGNGFRPEQTFGDRPIGGAVDSCVECAQRQQEPLSALWRKLMEGRPGGIPVKRAPKTVCGVRAHIEVAIERQFGGVREASGRRFPQPEPMLDAAKAHDEVPAVRPATQFACG